jgi:hypothetical protein
MIRTRPPLPPLRQIVTRSNDMTPTSPGWYGIVSGDGEGEVWVGTAYWRNNRWDRTMKCAYARSIEAFPTWELAEEWAHAQPD